MSDGDFLVELSAIDALRLLLASTSYMFTFLDDPFYWRMRERNAVLLDNIGGLDGLQETTTRLREYLPPDDIPAIIEAHRA